MFTSGGCGWRNFSRRDQSRVATPVHLHVLGKAARVFAKKAQLRLEPAAMPLYNFKRSAVTG
jgi:hypothetical protein